MGWSWWPVFRYRLGELREFLRYPLRLSLPASPDRHLHVVLYGVPYSDWNRGLSDSDIWRDIGKVSTVRRVPAFPILLPRPSPRIVVIPMKTGHALSVNRRHRSLLAENKILQMLDNKLAFQAYMEASVFARYCPRSYPSVERAVFPCVIKRLDLSASVGVRVVYSRSELEATLTSPIFAGEPYLLQELILGDVEYATSFLCDGGRVLWNWTYVSAMAGLDIVKNEDNSKRRWTIDTPPAALRQLEEVLTRLRYRGPCIVNYKIGPDGIVKIFEINPRFGGSLFRIDCTTELKAALGCLLANTSLTPRPQ